MSIVVSKNSQLDLASIEHYLHSAALPLRLAVNSGEGAPLVASHWFLYRDGAIYCVLHKSSLIARFLDRDGRCAFEVGSDQVPYRGVRGQARASLGSDGVETHLKALFSRYGIRPESRLARWLIGRVADERLVCLRPDWVSGWDFSERMADAVG